MSDPILMEQVIGQFEDHKLYEVSITQFDGKIYYFKKMFGYGSSLINLEGGTSTDRLQLFSFDLDTCEEKLVDGYKIEEWA